MEIGLSKSESSFRDEIRAWLASVERPAGLTDYGATPTKEDVVAARAWQRTLLDAGYAGLSWPEAYCGRGASGVERGVWAEETARANVPMQLNLVGLELAGPMIIKFGTRVQKARLLPAILSGEDVWCQLFSEPDAGSDLASLRTRATPRSDGWTVSGRKIWTSGGHYADMGLLLARTGTGSGGREGITCFVVEMSRSGISTRPLPQMNGITKFQRMFSARSATAGGSEPPHSVASGR
jgi:alkylation response protein AidB-like acyl-CoA dehydrogenase